MPYGRCRQGLREQARPPAGGPGRCHTGSFAGTRDLTPLLVSEASRVQLPLQHTPLGDLPFNELWGLTSL